MEIHIFSFDKITTACGVDDEEMLITTSPSKATCSSCLFVYFRNKNWWESDLTPSPVPNTSHTVYENVDVDVEKMHHRRAVAPAPFVAAREEERAIYTWDVWYDDKGRWKAGDVQMVWVPIRKIN